MLRLLLALLLVPTSPPPAGDVPPPDLVPLQTKLPKPGFDGEWMQFGRWRQANPEAEDCTERLAEFLVPRGTRNLALKRPVTSSDDEPVIGELKQINDGEKEGLEECMVEIAPGSQWVQIDLGEACTIYAILIWHSAAFPNLHRDVIVQLSNDPKFQRDVVTVFNNDRDNSSRLGKGTDREFFAAVGTKVIDARARRARYVRLYSNGNLNDDQNRYVEVEVHGLP